MEKLFLKILLFSCVFGVDFVVSLKCYLTGVPWPNECSFLIHERYGTSPACLSAVVLDEYKNEIEIRQCSKVGATDLPGGCELLHKKKTVKKCTLCETDYCNNPTGYSPAGKMRPTSWFSMVISLAVFISTR